MDKRKLTTLALLAGFVLLLGGALALYRTLGRGAAPGLAVEPTPAPAATASPEQAGPEEEAMEHIRNEELYKALRSIPRKQAERIYAYYFMDMTLEKISCAEGVSKVAVHKSIELGKKNLRKLLSDT